MGGLGPGIGGLEWVVIGLAALVVVGPERLPGLLRQLGKWTAKARGMANEFRASFDEMARQSELDDLRKEVEALRTGQSPYSPVRLGAEADAAFKDIRTELDRPALTPPPADPAAPAMLPLPVEPAVETPLDEPLPPMAPSPAEWPDPMSEAHVAAQLAHVPTPVAEPVPPAAPRSAKARKASERTVVPAAEAAAPTVEAAPTTSVKPRQGKGKGDAIAASRAAKAERRRLKGDV